MLIRSGLSNDDDNKKNNNTTNTTNKSKPHQLQERLKEAILVGETQVRPEPGRKPELQARALQSAFRTSQNAYVLHSHEACPGLLRLTVAHPVLYNRKPVAAFQTPAPRGGPAAPAKGTTNHAVASGSRGARAGAESSQSEREANFGDGAGQRAQAHLQSLCGWAGSEA